MSWKAKDGSGTWLLYFGYAQQPSGVEAREAGVGCHSGLDPESSETICCANWILNQVQDDMKDGMT